ncbi:hypothetical protein OKA04_06660 [Luteolibacter flavescens]|uniref:Uncharacterized protein n=1 Tax=Luteolibacter flavescens TaxID=1859460 RepID=A0ABT3FMC3_9BACT|nr:hypothetical protein [Luteolibacter flavescens]MCW1884406.1 hypothetical protein [Luteolibacter flavescens]
MAAAALLIAVFIGLGIQPGRSGVVAHGSSPQGVRYVVTQRWNGWDSWSEPYTVRLYTRGQGQPWQAYYVDHEARRWRRCSVRFSADGTVLDMTGGDKIERSFDLTRGEKSERPPFLPAGMIDEP